MGIENRPALLLVGNPQTSKNDTLTSIDLLEVSSFKNVVDEFDRALGLFPQGSLHPDRQIASVVMSVASHQAFVSGLEARVQPGMLDPENRRFKLVFTGHSVGEMASFIEAGVCDISTMARMLRERERITQHPLEAGFRQMVAIVGVDPDLLETRINELTARFAGTVELYIANYNTLKQGVIALIGKSGEARAAIDKLGEFISDIRNPEDPKKPLFPRIRMHPLLPNAFHTAGMAVEQAIYKQTIAAWLTEEFFSAPSERTLYSPTLPGWVTGLESVYFVAGNILTRPVKFTRAMHDLGSIPNLRAIITADVLSTTPKMVVENGIRVPVFNIKDKKSLGEAIDASMGLLSGSV